MTVRYRIVEDQVEEIHKVVVYSFQLGDVSEPELYAAIEIGKWLATEPGEFVNNHALQEIEIHKCLDPYSFGWRVAVTAELTKKKLSEFYLRFDKI